MSASLFGERFLGRREPAWHRLGEVFPADEQLTATEAMERADLMFKVSKLPMYVDAPDGTRVETDSFSIVREPTSDSPQWKVFGTVGSQWTAIEPEDLGRILDPISKEYPVETAGAIDEGKKIFLTLDAGQSKIAGEDHNLFYLVTDNRTGLGGLTIAFTPVRVVCQNTLTIGLNSASVSANLEHNKSITADTEWYADLFYRLSASREETVSAMDSLATVTIGTEDAEKVIVSAHPNPSKPRRIRIQDNIPADSLSKSDYLKIANDTSAGWQRYEGAMSRVESYRDAVRERYDVFNQEFPRVAQTPWAIWQAVVETEDYRKGQETSGSPFTGDRAKIKMRAFQTALELVR